MNKEEKGKPAKDRRDHESWLHDALELTLHRRFHLGEPRASKDDKGHERALIVHGQRSSNHPDFALLDADRKLILVELKDGEIKTESSADKVVEQMRDYVKDYRKRKLVELAEWYCHHGVDVNTRFGYRGEDYIIPNGKFEYGRLNRWVLDSLDRYRGPCGKDDPSAAGMLEILGQDYQHHVGDTLDGLKTSSRLEVGRCILVAQGWPVKFKLEEIEGAKVELWSYPDPGEWAGPGKRKVVVET